jgi:serine phosphatase RsbU (regulator of sigma subunit)
MSEKTPSILIVDDEEMVLSSLRGVFALQTDYNVLEATDPRKAIAELKRTPIDVIISDFLMPEMNGIEFLKQAKKLQPDSARLLLTGYADKENAIRAINDVGLYHYMEKPWDNDALLNIVGNALQEKGLRKQLAEKVRELDRVSSQHKALERELEMAARVQRSLLPNEFPSFEDFRFAHLYRPSEAVGGDFFDVLTIGDRAVLFVSDVIGHGVQAALTTMFLKGVFQEAAPEAPEPVTLLTEMNRRIHAVLPSGMYAAAAAFFLQSGSNEILFSNAGLPYPFVLRQSKRLDEIVLSGSPLGLFPPDVLPYEPRTIVAEPGDVLIAGSDGIGSIVAADGEMFDDEALRSTLAELAGCEGDHILRELLNRALAFGNEKPLPDDVNLVAVTKVG